MVKAGLEAIYLSGWQVAADANLSGSTYPDQSLYPANSAPALVKRLNSALMRADQIDWAEGRNGTHWFAPILADAEAGFGGPLNAYELMRSDDRGGRRRRALRGPARVREEVRPPRREGARADDAVRPHAERGAARGRRPRRADRARGADGRAVRRAADERHRRVRPRVRQRRPHRGGLLPRPRRHRRGHLPRARLRAVRRPALVRDVDAGPRRGARVRGRDPRAVSRASCWRTTARRPSTGARRCPTTTSPASRTGSTTGATASSSSRSPASTRSTRGCSTSRAGTLATR